MKASDWRPDELCLRSLVVRAETGEVLSSGVPKFFNFGESDSASIALRAALAADKPVTFT
jgi:hypothetical protein